MAVQNEDTVKAVTALRQQVQGSGGFFFIDRTADEQVRGELAALLGPFAMRRGLQVLDLSDPGADGTFNPLANGQPGEVAERLLAVLPAADGNPQAQALLEQTSRAVTAIVEVLATIERPYSMASLTALMSTPVQLLDLANTLPASHPQARSFHAFLEEVKDPAGKGLISAERLKGKVGGLVGRLSQLSGSSYWEILSNQATDIDLPRVVARGGGVYCRIPSYKQGSLRECVLEMALLQVVGSHEKLSKPPAFLISSTSGTVMSL
ncbi:MAG TPA: hypothetical protein VMB48_13540 [Steroidobacteraceae bacterium]|nr:hypothetical protein [Steroidobacteraceae bacterium]